MRKQLLFFATLFSRFSTDRTQVIHIIALLVSQTPAVLPFTESDAQSDGVLCAALNHVSRNAIDRLIATHAVNAGLTLVTNNESDLKDYPSLSVENWAA